MKFFCQVKKIISVAVIVTKKHESHMHLELSTLAFNATLGATVSRKANPHLKPRSALESISEPLLI